MSTVTYSKGFPKHGFEAAQQVMNLGHQHGWRMLCDPRDYGWTQLELWRGDEYLQINWTEKNGYAKLAHTRQYRTPTRSTRSFSFAEAKRIITRRAP